MKTTVSFICVICIFAFLNTVLHPEGGKAPFFRESDIRQGRFVEIGDFLAKLSGVAKTKEGASVEVVTMSAIPGFNVASIEFRAMKVGADGISEYPVAKGSFSYSRAGWKVEFDSLTLDDEGLRGEAYMVLPERLGKYTIVFPDFRIKADGTMVSGKIGQDKSMLLHGWEFALEGATLALSGKEYRLEASEVTLSLAYIDGPDICFGPVVFDSDWNFGTFTGTATTSFTSTNGYAVESFSCLTDKKGIFFSGSIRSASWPESSAIPTEGYGIRLLPDGSVKTICPLESGSWKFAGWDISGKKLTFDYDRILIESNRVTFRGVNVELGPLSIDSEDSLIKGSLLDNRQTLPIFGGRLQMIESRFDDEGLFIKAFGSLPENLGGYSVFFDYILLHPDGKFEVDGTIDRFQFDVGAFSFTAEDLWLNNERLASVKTEIRFPESLGSGTLVVSGFSIMNDGSIGTEIRMYPASLFGLFANFDTIAVSGDGFSFSGYIGLPESLPSPISGKKLPIAKLTVGNDGTIREIDSGTSFEATVSFIGESWALRVGGAELRYEGKPWLVMKDAEIHSLFLGGPPAKIGNLRYDPISASWDFQGITGSDPFSWAGENMTWTMAIVSIPDADTVVLKGWVVIDESYVNRSLAGKRVDFETLSLDGARKIKGFALSEAVRANFTEADIDALIGMAAN